jgi:hypothetical protein
VLKRNAPDGIIYKILTGKFEGRLRNKISFFPKIRTKQKMIKLNRKLIISDKPRRFIDSLSDFGSTIVSS